MKPNEKILSYINKTQQFCMVLKGMIVHSDDKEMTIAQKNGLSTQFENTTKTLNAFRNDVNCIN